MHRGKAAVHFVFLLPFEKGELGCISPSLRLREGWGGILLSFEGEKKVPPPSSILILSSQQM
jgi:hypothetical protein